MRRSGRLSTSPDIWPATRQGAAMRAGGSVGGVIGK